MCENFLLSAVTSVSPNENRSILGNIELFDKKYIAVGDRACCIHTFVWDEENNQYNRVNSIKGHESAVSAIAYLKPCEWMPEGALVTSSRDKLILLWPNTIFTEKVDKLEPIATLVGHENNVCSLKTNDNGMIISSSWDGTARVWSNGSEIIKITQENTIWDVVEVPIGYATLGADKSIRVYNKLGEQLYCENNAHNDVVRSGLFIPEKSTLITTSNDGTIREWRIEEDGKIKSLDITFVTDTYIYSMIMVDKYYIACSEDKCAYIVDSEKKEVVDVLPIPGVAWDGSKDANGIIITSTDGYVYSFTTCKSKEASEETVQKYIGKCGGQTFSNPQFEQINILDLCELKDVESTKVVPGRFEAMRDGEKIVLVVHNNSYGWMKVGTLTKTKGAQAQKYIGPDGKEYDFCLYVEMEDGVTKYPLYLNYDTNPYTAASDFMYEHKLPMSCLDTIAKFIINSLDGQKVDIKKRIPDESQENIPESSLFPLEEPNYVLSMKTEPILSKLKKSFNEVDLLTEEELTILGSPISEKWLDVASKVLLTWDVDKSWPVLDIMRAYILDENAKKYIPEDFVEAVIEHFSDSADRLSDYGVMGIMRLIGNLGKNYSSIELEKLDMPFIFNKFIGKINSLPKIAQIPFINAIMNYSINETKKKNDGQEVINLLVKALSGPLDDEALYRGLLALGNTAQSSTSAKNELILHPEVLDRSDMSERCEIVVKEIAKIIQ